MKPLLAREILRDRFRFPSPLSHNPAFIVRDWDNIYISIAPVVRPLTKHVVHLRVVLLVLLQQTIYRVAHMKIYSVRLEIRCPIIDILVLVRVLHWWRPPFYWVSSLRCFIYS